MSLWAGGTSQNTHSLLSVGTVTTVSGNELQFYMMCSWWSGPSTWPSFLCFKRSSFHILTLRPWTWCNLGISILKMSSVLILSQMQVWWSLSGYSLFSINLSFFFFKKNFILIWGLFFFPIAFREREIHLCETEMLIGCLLIHSLTGDQIQILGMCPDWESNLWPSGLQDHAPTNWATLARAIVLLNEKDTWLEVRKCGL